MEITFGLSLRDFVAEDAILGWRGQQPRLQFGKQEPLPYNLLVESAYSLWASSALAELAQTERAMSFRKAFPGFIKNQRRVIKFRRS